MLLFNVLCRFLIPAAIIEEGSLKAKNLRTHVKIKRKFSMKTKKTIEEKLNDVKCPDDGDIPAWNCPVCLYILRLELRMNFGIIPNHAKHKF